MVAPAFSYDDYLRLFGGGNPLLRQQMPNFAGMPQFQYQRGGGPQGMRGLQGPGAVSGGGAGAAAYYQSNPNNTAMQQFSHDVTAQSRNPATWATMAVGPDAFQAVKSYQGWKTSRAQAHEAEQAAQRAQAGYLAQAPTNWLLQNLGGSQAAQAAISREGTGNQLKPEEVQAMLDAEQQANTRKSQTAQVEDFFNSPDRAAQQDKYTQDVLNSQLGSINHDYDLGLTKTVQSTAAQGLLGGSVDQERQADVNRSHDSAVASAGQQAQQSRQQMTAQDQALKEHLLDVINAGDPAQRQAAADRLQQIEDQAAGIGQQNTLNQQGQDIAQQYRTNQSQALGSGINGVSSFLSANPNRGTGQWWGAGSSGTGG